VSYAVMRKNILTAMENSYAEQLLAEAEGQRIAAGTADAAEGGVAFMEKRKAEFKGK
jgi:2-(1,2-epoxy-1,2-dihydrophenyl)acetyl-CoA isomerase